MRTLALVTLACASCAQPYRRAPVSAAELVPPARRASEPIGPGPLSLVARVADSSWPDRQAARAYNDFHKLDADRIHVDGLAYLAMLDAYYPPRSPETRDGAQIAHRGLPRLERLAPYSIESIANAFAYSGERQHLCVRPANAMFHCPGFEPSPAPTGSIASFSEPTPGIGMLAIRDFADSTAAEWAEAREAIARAAHERAVVVDLRTAVGDDPRGAMELVAALAGRTDLLPLVGIVRPGDADGFAAAYRARYRAEGRDATLWKPLVGAIDSPGQDHARRGDGAPHPRPVPIEILISPACGAACELAARTLETYADAVVIGGAAPVDRLARDEPALLTLPGSQIDIFFFATAYLLAPAIEAATGPTEHWRAQDGDADAGDPVAFAVREASERAAHPDQPAPRCTALPKVLPAALRDRLVGADTPPRMCEGGLVVSIDVEQDVPLSAVRRFVATCNPSFIVSGLLAPRYDLRGWSGAGPDPGVLAQIAQAPYVKRVWVDCAPRSYPN